MTNCTLFAINYQLTSHSRVSFEREFRAKVFLCSLNNLGRFTSFLEDDLAVTVFKEKHFNSAART